MRDTPLWFQGGETLFNYDLHKKYIYVVEGPDCSGKTTVCKEIQRCTGYPIYHMRYFSDEKKMNAQFEWIEKYLKHWLYDDGDGKGIILDRFVLSNQVYQSVFKDGPIVKNSQALYDFLVKEQTFANVTFVNCLPSDRERWLKFFEKMSKEREEQYTDIERMRIIHEKYDENFYYKYNFAFHHNKGIEIRSLFYDLFLEMDEIDKDYDKIEVDMAEILSGMV